MDLLDWEQESVAASLEKGNEIPCSTEGGVFIDKLSGCHERNVFGLVSCHLPMLSFISNETR